MSMTATAAVAALTDAQTEFLSALPVHMDRTRELLSLSEERELISEALICWDPRDQSWYPTGKAIRAGLADD